MTVITPGVMLCIMLVVTAGCATRPSSAIVAKQAIAAPCDVPVPPRPVFPAETLTGNEDPFTLGVTLWADRKARQAYELQIEIALAGCTRK